MFVLALVVGLFAYDNKEFFDTVGEQRADGHYWKQIDCRDLENGLPALTIDTPTGRKIVCHKLVK